MEMQWTGARGRNLAPMRFKTFVWPHNPESFEIRFARAVSAQKIPLGGVYMQGLGLSYRVMSGRGVFFGKNAYEDFKRLAGVFYENTPGSLVHPIWQSTSAWLVNLSLAQEPQEDFVSYTFTFWEDTQGYKAALEKAPVSVTVEPSPAPLASGVSAGAVHTVKKGDTLWAISRQYGVTLESVVKLNPQIKNPNLIYPGERVRVK